MCGQAFNLGVSELPGMVNMWGIYTTSKEANMYPKPVQDLSGWNVRSIACSTKVTVLESYAECVSLQERLL